MAVTMGKPILVGGISISLALWLWGSFGTYIQEIGELSLLGAIAVGGCFWWMQKKFPREQFSTTLLSPLNEETVTEAIASAQEIISLLETEAPEENIFSLQEALNQLPQQIHRKSLQVGITGGKKTGKTTLQELLKQKNLGDNINLIETSPLFTPSLSQERTAQELIHNCDLVLFIINGDLTESEWQTLQELHQERQRILIIFNKQDQYLPDDKAFILEQLQQRVESIISKEDILPINAAPSLVKVKKYQEDGTVVISEEQSLVNIDNLIFSLTNILSQEKQQLIWATTWREAWALKNQAKQTLNQARRKRAMPIIEQYQWIAAASTLANPVAALDLLATAAINTQLLIDLSAIYQQKFSFEQAQTASGTIGKAMVKLGLVEISTQTIGSILKTNTFTYLAGGAIQGISAAYLTRIAGLSLIEYWQDQEINSNSQENFNLAKFTTKLNQVWQQNQRTTFLQSFVKQAMIRIFPESAEAKT